MQTVLGYWIFVQIACVIPLLLHIVDLTLGYFKLKKAEDWWWDHVIRPTWWMRHSKYQIDNWWTIRQFPPDTVIEDCRYHPCIIIENDGGDLQVLSLIDNKRYGCSLFHCGIQKLTAEQVETRITAYEENGARGLMKDAGWTDEQVTEFENDWRLKE